MKKFITLILLLFSFNFVHADNKPQKVHSSLDEHKTSIENVKDSVENQTKEVYTIEGIKVPNKKLNPGVYIIKLKNNKTKKIVIKK